MSYLFDGSGDLLNCGDHNALVSTAWTVSAWIKLAGTAGEAVVLTQRDAYGDGTNCFEMYVGGNNTLGVTVKGNYRAIAFAGAATLSNGTWYHVAMACDATSAINYLDGSAGVPDVSDWSAGSGTAIALGIGGLVTEATGYFNGRLAEVALYDKKLSGAEVSALACGDSPQAVASGNLVDHWRLKANATSYTGTRNGSATGNAAVDADHPTVDDPPGGSVVPVHLLRTHQLGLSGLSL